MSIGDFLHRLVPDKHKPKAPIAYNNKTIKLIREIDDPGKLDELSNLGIDIHWKGTEYEKEYNK